MDRQHESKGKVLRRRGILAAAAAVVAGLVAKQAVPVAAANSPLLLNQDNPATAPTSITITGGPSTSGDSFKVNATGTSSAVAGYNSGTACVGVYALTSGNGAYGMLAVADGTGPLGTIGVSGQAQTGIEGISVGLTPGPNQIGVHGDGGVGNGVYGTTSGTGLVAGLYGTSSTAYGIIGNTTAPFYSGLTATTNTTNCAAFAATSTNPAAFAAYFQGFTYVQGSFAVSGNKSAAVMHPDGTRRLLYCVESPEAWFEDFGEGKLVNGAASIKLDPDFAALVHGDTFLVFLTGSDKNSEGLVVTAKRADGFVVEERKGGKSSGSFAWRAVAKRKDNPGKRLEKLVVPKFNLPDPDKLPKPIARPKKP